MGEALKTRIFISYSRKDAAFADQLAAALDARGYAAFLDREDISDAEPWRERLEALILEADAVAFVLSPDSIASPVCDWETRRTVELGKRLLPLHFRAFEQRPPEQLSRLNYIPIDAEDKFDIGVERLCAACDVDIAWVREHTRLVSLATRWDSSGRRDDPLLRGAELGEAEAWLARRVEKAPEVPDMLLVFLQSSRNAETLAQQREQDSVKRTRRLRLGIGGTALLTVVIAALAYVGLTRMVANASAQRSNTLAEIANSAVENAQYDSGARFARAALFGADDPLTGFDASKAEEALRRAATYSGALGVIRAHDGGVTSVAFNPDGTRILSTGHDGKVRLWDAATNGEVATMLSGNGSPSAYYSADGSRILSYEGGNATIYVWDRDGRAVRTLTSEEPVSGAAISPNGQRVAAAGYSFTADASRAQVWDVEQGRELFAVFGTGAMTGIKFNNDGSRLISTGAPRLWDATNGRFIADLWLPSETYRPHDSFGGFTPDGALAISTSDNGDIELWNARTGAHVRTLSGHRIGIHATDFDAARTLMVTTSRDGVRVWDMQTWRAIALTTVGATDAAAISPRGGRMVSVHQSSALFWNLTNRQEQASAFYGDAVMLGLPVYYRGHEGAITSIAYAPDAERFITGGEDGTIRVWNAQPHVRVDQEQRWISNLLPVTRTQLERYACETMLVNGLSHFTPHELEVARSFDPSLNEDACRGGSPWRRFLQTRNRAPPAPDTVEAN